MAILELRHQIHTADLDHTDIQDLLHQIPMEVLVRMVPQVDLALTPTALQ